MFSRKISGINSTGFLGLLVLAKLALPHFSGATVDFSTQLYITCLAADSLHLLEMFSMLEIIAVKVQGKQLDTHKAILSGLIDKIAPSSASLTTDLLAITDASEHSAKLFSVASEKRSHPSFVSRVRFLFSVLQLSLSTHPSAFPSSDQKALLLPLLLTYVFYFVSLLCRFW